MSDFTCNTNYLAPTGFKVVISRKEYPHLQFFAQEVIHPSLDLPAASAGFSRLAGIPFPGDALSFGELSLTVIMDEEMGVYEELYNWMIRLVNEKHKPQTGSLYRDDDKLASYSDLTLIVLTSHNNTNRKVKYQNIFPVSVGSIPFTSTSDGQYITFTVTFKFDYFNFA
jgi:hypothetical protein